MLHGEFIRPDEKAAIRYDFDIMASGFPQRVASKDKRQI
jgi:hypothetical protein